MKYRLLKNGCQGLREKGKGKEELERKNLSQFGEVSQYHKQSDK